MTQVGDDLAGRRLGACQLLERLGSGGMGVVYRAAHDVHGQVCVKVVRPELVSS